MSRQRALARTQRERAVAEQTAQREAQRAKLEARRRRADRRAARWRGSRLWRGTTRRHREVWATVLSLAIVALVTTYLVFRSLSALVFVLLVLLIAAPAIVSLTVRRR